MPIKQKQQSDSSANKAVSVKKILTHESNLPSIPTEQSLEQSLQIMVRAAVDAGSEDSAKVLARHPGRIVVRVDGIGSVEIDFTHPQLHEITEWQLLPLARPREDRVSEAKRLLSENNVYLKGCSQFVCAVLGINYELANDLMGDKPTLIGAKPPYPLLKPGDIVGWRNTTGSGHVAVYIGEDTNNMFIDVREPGTRPRSKNGFYDREIFKSSRF